MPNRTSGSSLMPVSSFVIATTAAPCFATNGNTCSSRSSSPVTEFTSGLPSHASSPASSAATIDESIESGTSVSDCTSRTVSARIAGSSASGMPAFTSSMWAPASICAATSPITVVKSPAAISAASFLRPVGLIRSPMITNGRSNPITTSVVALETTVSVTRAPRRRRSRGEPAVRGELIQALVVELALEPLGEGLGGGAHVVTDGALLAFPLAEVVVGPDEPDARRGRVDRLLEAVGQDDLRGVATSTTEHLRRDVAPPHDRDVAHQPAAARSARRAFTSACAVSAAIAASRQYASAPTALPNSSFNGAPPTSTM